MHPPLQSKSVCFDQIPNGQKLLHVKNGSAQADILLSSARLINYTPRLHKALLHSPQPLNTPDTHPVYGGIAPYWPWQGVNTDNSHHDMPLLEQNSSWRLIRAHDISDSETLVVFELIFTPDPCSLWHCPFQLRYSLKIGPTLELSMHTTLLHASEITLGLALMAYLHIGQITKTSIRGLSNYHYIDKQTQTGHIQTGMLSLSKGIERTYMDMGDYCEVQDPVLQRRLIISSHGCQSLKIWDPASTQEAMPTGQCIALASGYTSEYAKTLEPGLSQRMSLQYRIIDY